MNLAFCISKKDLGSFVCSLQSVVLHGGYEHYDVYVLDSFLSESTKQALSENFEKSVTFHFIPECEDLFADGPEGGRYPKELFLRAALPLLLPVGIDRVLFLDVNTIVINPLNDLYEIDFEGTVYAGCSHAFSLVAEAEKHSMKRKSVDPGVLLINLPVIHRSLKIDQISDYAKNYPRFLPKENIFGDLWGHDIKLMDAIRYNLSDHVLRAYNAKHRHEAIDLPWIRENTVVINYCDKDKPWESGYSGKLGVFYQELLKH